MVGDVVVGGVTDGGEVTVPGIGNGSPVATTATVTIAEILFPESITVRVELPTSTKAKPLVKT